MDLVAGGVKCLLKQVHGSLPEEMMFEQRPDLAPCTWVSGDKHFGKRDWRCQGPVLRARGAFRRGPLAFLALGLGRQLGWGRAGRPAALAGGPLA